MESIAALRARSIQNVKIRNGTVGGKKHYPSIKNMLLLLFEMEFSFNNLTISGHFVAGPRLRITSQVDGQVDRWRNGDFAVGWNGVGPSCSHCSSFHPT